MSDLDDEVGRIVGEATKTDSGATAGPADPAGYTDIDNAAAFLARHGRDLLHDGNDWYVWDGRRFAVDVRSQVMERAKATVEGRVAAARATGDGPTLRAAMSCLNLRRLHAMVDTASSDPRVRVTAEELDADLTLLNVANGTIDLTTGTLRIHDRADRITKLSPVPYEPDAKCPRFMAFLAFIMLDRATLIEYVERLAGSCLSGEVREHVFHVLYGRGRNGKGTLIRILHFILGDYSIQANTATFVDSKIQQSGSSHQEDLTRLRGARFVAAEEVNKGCDLNMGRIKTLTGGDIITARSPYAKHSIEFVPQATFALAVNDRPHVPDSGDGTWARLRLLPFEAHIEKPDPDFERLLREEAVGILAWAVRGTLAWRRDGLCPPGEVMAATSEYRQDTNPLLRFIADRCVLGTFRRAEVGKLMGEYRDWCKANDEEPLSTRRLGDRLLELGCKRDKGTGGVRRWTGIAILSDPGLSLVEESGASGGTDPGCATPEDAVTTTESPESGASGASGPSLPSICMRTYARECGEKDREIAPLAPLYEASTGNDNAFVSGATSGATSTALPEPGDVDLPEFDGMDVLALDTATTGGQQ